MKRLLIILASGVLIAGMQSCDYGITPGETDGQSVEQGVGERSSNLIVRPTATTTAPGVSNTEQNKQADNQDPQQSQTDKGHSPSYNQNINTKISPLRVNTGTKAHGDPKTW